MKRYDHKALLKAFRGLKSGNVSGQKTQLLTQCLTILAEPGAMADRPAAVVDTVRMIKVLIARNIHGEAHKRLRRALKQAVELEMFNSICTLIDLDRTIGDYAQATREPAHMAKMRKLEAETIRAMAEYCEKKAFYTLVAEIRDLPEKTRWQRIDHALKIIPEQTTCLSFRSRLVFLLAKAELYRLAERPDHSGLTTEAIIAGIESRPKFIEDPAVRRTYRAFVYESGCVAATERDLPKLDSRAEKLRRLLREYSHEAGDEIGEMLVDLKLEACTGNFHISRRAMLLYASAESCIRLGRFSEAAAWLCRLADLGDEIDQELVASSKLLELIVYYEREFTELLESSIARVRYFFNSRNRLKDFELAVLRFFRRSVGAPLVRQRRALLKELRAQVVRLFDDPAYSRQREAFDLIAWIDSQLTRRPMIDILRERAGRNQIQN